MGLTPKSPKQVDSSVCTCLGPAVIRLMCISVSATAVNGLIFHLHSPGCSITAEPWSCPFSLLPSQNSSCCCTQSPPVSAGWKTQPQILLGSSWSWAGFLTCAGKCSLWGLGWVGSDPSPPLGGTHKVTNSNQHNEET